MEHINEQMADYRHKIERKNKLVREVEKLSYQLIDEKSKLVELEDILNKENHDVEKLQSFTFANLWANISARKDERLSKEENDAYEALCAYQRKENDIAVLTMEIEHLKKEIEGLKAVELAYDDLMMEKKRMIYNDDIANLDHTIQASQLELKEVQEAIQAGESVLESLDQTRKSLSSASSWGLYDMLGGGIFATAMKHDRIHDAERELQQLQFRLKKFEKEINDVKIIEVQEVSLGQFMSLADYFIDGFLVDFMVQSKINDSLRRVNDCSNEIKNILHSLDERIITLKEMIHDCNTQLEQRLLA